MKIESVRKRKEYKLGDVVDLDGRYMLIVKERYTTGFNKNIALLDLRSNEIFFKEFSSMEDLNLSVLNDAPIVNAKVVIE
ncbi:hypothetical protein FGO85_01220 [Ligilactobacillus salivarius]|uniref:hypothetical protein n=1 Tax=Ligilactobacillus salivarius TaxID=1624 RepID=UPI0011C8AD86|nr:hypothetical protein [Ligilactobacillus salivarius]TXJ78202.1 hypothetical protein FGO85_01220 [Ligilactobacillus salivarius]